MRILYLCHRFPYPPKRGGKIRPFNMIRHLAQRHEVNVVSLVRSAEEAREGEGLAKFCAHYRMAAVREPIQWLRMIARLPTPAPSSMGYFHSPEVARHVHETLEREPFDLIFVHCSSVAPYVARVEGIPKILDFGDMDSQKWREYARYKPFPLSLGYALEGRKLERAERSLARQFDLCTCTTRAEWETLEGFAAGVATDWFPNGVDSGYFAPSDEQHEPETIVFVGRMDYYPNQECMFEFCATTFPQVRARRPRAQLLIVGADPSPEVQRLAAIDGVTVTGSVPDVRPYLRRAAVMIAPLNIARGTQNKILEAMASGVPVIASRACAGGIDAVAGEHLLTASTTSEYVAALESVLGDAALRRRLAVAGRERMLSHHAWDKSMRRLDDIVHRCVTNYARKGALQTA